MHYVGGTEDDNEWVKVNPERIQLSPLIEIVWARIKHGPKASNQDGKSQDWPAVVIEGSLRDSFCKKLQVFHLLHDFLSSSSLCYNAFHIRQYTQRGSRRIT